MLAAVSWGRGRYSCDFSVSLIMISEQVTSDRFMFFMEVSKHVESKSNQTQQTYRWDLTMMTALPLSLKNFF